MSKDLTNRTTRSLEVSLGMLIHHGVNDDRVKQIKEELERRKGNAD